MAQILLRTHEAISEELEERIINELRPEFNLICYNPVRACIIHLLIKAYHLNHSMRVEELSKKLGKRHSVIIHHLEQLSKWNLVNVVKNYNHGNKLRRSIWGLNLKLPNLIYNVYGHILKFFYTHDELEKMTSINKNVRFN